MCCYRYISHLKYSNSQVLAALARPGIGGKTKSLRKEPKPFFLKNKYCETSFEILHKTS
jgi:hypothetical protein